MATSSSSSSNGAHTNGAQSSAVEHTDALVVGGGPIGLLIAAQLVRFGCTATVIERDDKPSMPIYGRATTLWCRTLELLDQLGLCDPLMEEGCFTKDGVNFRNGKAVPGGLTFGQRMDKHGDTRFNLSLHLRQRLIERKFEDALEDLGSPARHSTVLEGYSTADESEGLEYPVTSTVRDLATDEVYTVKSKVIVGVDGGRSFVRKQAGIAFNGNRTANKWIRIDALVETDMPSPRTLNSVQSETHGLVLWCPIDGGRIRMGYVFSAELMEKYGEDGVTAEVAMAEAKKAVAPFKLEFKQCDWFTLYGIGQCMAETFIKDRVILAGDACHTHSSGSAQGLNTGIFDATNLAWKLAMFLKGTGTRELLDSYSTERMAVVNQMIENDKIISTLISGQLPPKFAGRTEPPRQILDEWFEQPANLAFTLGLGVGYPANNAVNEASTGAAPLCSISAGQRGPETYVSRLGTGERIPLQRAMPNDATFYAVIFAGVPSGTNTRASILSLRAWFDEHPEADWRKIFGRKTVKTLTLVGAAGPSAYEALGNVASFGATLYDATLEAHHAYGVDPQRGAVVVFRPDGFVSKVVDVADAGDELLQYFGKFLVPVQKAKQRGAKGVAVNGMKNGNGH